MRTDTIMWLRRATAPETRWGRAAFFLISLCVLAATTACGKLHKENDAGTGGGAATGGGDSTGGGEATGGGRNGSGGGSAAGDGGFPCDGATTGLVAPLPVCTVSDPCSTPSGVRLTTSMTTPACSAKDGGFDDGPAVTYVDVDGQLRADCEYVPPGAGQTSLLVFFHGSLSSASGLYDNTSLRKKAAADGFALVSIQGRNLHYPQVNFSGSHHDYFYRDLGSPSTNPDIRNADVVIDRLVATGKIDPQQIYVSGWSNGAFFAQLYAIARHVTPTPGGNHVAAGAVYAGADPFSGVLPGDTSCQLTTYPHSTVPLYIVHRACDALVPCNQSQEQQFSLPPTDVADWVALAPTAAGIADPNFESTTIDGAAMSTSSCSTVCTSVIGTENHLNWPDGQSDASGHDWEPAMLTFLKNHPLP